MSKVIVEAEIDALNPRTHHRIGDKPIVVRMYEYEDGSLMVEAESPFKVPNNLAASPVTHNMDQAVVMFCKLVDLMVQMCSQVTPLVSLGVTKGIELVSGELLGPDGTPGAPDGFDAYQPGARCNAPGGDA